ncbi:MAG TPA: SRPBCC family protein [Bacteroidia bacterium]|nr:SRPBCC family protein [Bacteroidia bacterium]HRD39477.1 SRPBCC family protein [Bacteroidia bacterium]
MSIYTLQQTQRIPAPIKTVWEFISSPYNLKLITPEYMGFEVLTKDLPKEMYPGMIIAYTVKPLMNIPMTWVTEITQVRDFEFFVDEQRIGPYKLWHHQHHIREVEGGVLMTDIVNYKPPLGVLGDLSNSIIIRKKLDEIFLFRKKKVEQLFGV